MNVGSLMVAVSKLKKPIGTSPGIKRGEGQSEASVPKHGKTVLLQHIS